MKFSNGQAVWFVERAHPTGKKMTRRPAIFIEQDPDCKEYARISINGRTMRCSTDALEPRDGSNEKISALVVGTDGKTYFLKKSYPQENTMEIKRRENCKTCGTPLTDENSHKTAVKNGKLYYKTECKDCLAKKAAAVRNQNKDHSAVPKSAKKKTVKGVKGQEIKEQVKGQGARGKDVLPPIVNGCLFIRLTEYEIVSQTEHALVLVPREK